MRSARYGGILAAAMVLAFAACSGDQTTPATSFTADLSGAKEIPPTPSTATGKASCTISGTAFSCTVTYSGLLGNPTASHIHLANAGATGGVRVNLCGVVGTPACPAATSGTITSGVQSPTLAAGQNAQQAFDQVAAAIGAYGAYVNIHSANTTTCPACANGEIRGQLFVKY